MHWSGIPVPFAMSILSRLNLHWAILWFLAFPLPAAVYQQSWEKGYDGADATGPHVLGYWKFDAGAELKDSSSKGHDLSLAGGILGAEGKHGQALECGHEMAKSHGAKVQGQSSLSPAGAFTLEMWVKPKAGGEKTGRCYLADKRYVPDNHTDYAWQLGEMDNTGSRRLLLTLGFGSTSETFASVPCPMPADQWQHLAVTYDAAGTVTFYHNGSLIDRIHKPGVGAITPGTRPLHLGDRIGSNYGGFPGLIDEVRLCQGALKFESLSVVLTGNRRVWQRMESASSLSVLCTNLRREASSGARLQLTLPGKNEVHELPDLEPGASHEIKVIPDTSLKPGDYEIRATLHLAGQSATVSHPCKIVPRPSPAMPVILWGHGDYPRMKDIGFTHSMSLGVSNLAAIWEKRLDPESVPPAADAERIAKNHELLDEALAEGMGIVARLSPSHWLESQTAWLRTNPDGTVYPRHDIAAIHPELPPFFEKVGRSFSQAYGRHPALTATLVNTEVRDASQPSYTAADLQAWKAFSGLEAPPEGITRRGMDWTALKDFPADRVIPDNHPVLAYMRWFWTVGDGWNALHTALSKGIKSAARRGHWTFFDPAVRQPSISGAGGQVDVLSHWTYTYPDPQRIGLCTDQLMAMAEASGRRQQVMKMTQLIWYRSQTAPIKKTRPEDPVAWEDHDPEAAYITISPLHLKEALWTKLSRPVQGIMYHGWQSLVPTESTSAYRFTNPNAAPVLKQLLHEVVQPLGPTLMKIPDERAEIVFLESFTSQMFARRGGYGGNNTWSADLWMALQHAHIRTDVIFEETLLKKGLTGRRILVMPECDVLSESVVAHIKAWQKRGGKILADEFLCPALKADAVVPSFKRVKNALQDKQSLLELAARLAPQLKELGHVPLATADSPEAVLRVRRAGDARYLFVINDCREAGNYVGQHGLVLENGLPLRTNVTWAEEKGTIYDLTRGSQIIPQRDAEGRLTWPVHLGPGDGRIFMILPKPLLHLHATLPDTATPGHQAVLQVQISSTNPNEDPVKAVVPLKIEILDSNGVRTEGSGYHAAENGQLTLPLDIASNEEIGTWEVRVTELASRMETALWMRLKNAGEK